MSNGVDVSVAHSFFNRIPNLEHIIMFGTKQPNATFPGTHPLAEVFGMGTKETREKMEQATKNAQPDDPFNIQFTSGTTGAPKGATLSSFGLMNAAYFSGQRTTASLPVRMSSVTW